MRLKLSTALVLGGVPSMGTLDESSVDLEENVRARHSVITDVDMRTLNLLNR